MGHSSIKSPTRAWAPPSWAIARPAAAHGAFPHWAAGPRRLPLALFFFEAFSNLIAKDKLVNSK